MNEAAAASDARAHVDGPAAHYLFAAGIGSIDSGAIARIHAASGVDASEVRHIGRPLPDCRADAMTALRAAMATLPGVVDEAAAYGAAVQPWSTTLPTLDVRLELDRLCLEAAALPSIEAAALILWGVAWLHPFANGNGRTSRAAAYAITLVGDPELRELHRRRIGATGRESLLWIERIRRRTEHYFAIQNAAHRDAFDGVRYRRPDLSAHVAWITELIADVKARRPSLESLGPGDHGVEDGRAGRVRPEDPSLVRGALEVAQVEQRRGQDLRGNGRLVALAPGAEVLDARARAVRVPAAPVRGDAEAVHEPLALGDRVNDLRDRLDALAVGAGQACIHRPIPPRRRLLVELARTDQDRRDRHQNVTHPIMLRTVRAGTSETGTKPRKSAESGRRVHPASVTGPVRIRRPARLARTLPAV